MNNAISPSRHRERNPSGSHAIIGHLIEAAELEFASHGFDGASTRSIALRAGAHQPQINYHFTSKLLLWQAVVDRLFLALDASLVIPLVESVDVAMAEGVRQFLDFSARRPALNRIINLEATGESERLRWLVATHLRPHFDLTATIWQQVRAEGRGAELSAAEVWELLTTYGALRFANAPMISLLEGPNTVDAQVQTRRILAILFPDGAPTLRR